MMIMMLPIVVTLVGISIEVSPDAWKTARPNTSNGDVDDDDDDDDDDDGSNKR